ncbi:MAG TPA: hypothetical protein VEX68_26515, partial [Bryobacteraceae bacterium]|nr:hypothetical protein [Bryobacteraceae bacterium]
KPAASHARDHRSAEATPLFLPQSASVPCRYLNSFALLDQCGLLGRLQTNESPMARLDRAFRAVLHVPKEEMLKEEAKIKDQKAQKKAAKKPS